MLNVKAVQKNLPQRYLKAAARCAPEVNKGDDKWRWVYDSDFYVGEGWCDLPYTCSAFELGQPRSDSELAAEIAEALRTEVKYLQCSVTDKKVAKRLEKFGFSKVTEYMGAHSARVSIYHINLEGFTF